jgi:integrase
VLAIHYGLRQGELLGLKWSDLQGNTLQVRRRMYEARVGRRIEEETKNGKGRRIELSEKAVETLRSHRRRQVGVMDTEYISLLRRARQRTPVTSCTAASNRLSSVPGYPK